MNRGIRLCIMAATLAVTASAAAQGAAQGLLSADRNRGQGKDLPVQIDAKTLEVRDKSKIATFSGKVKVVQGDTTMHCDKLVVFYGQEIGIADNKQAVQASADPGALPGAQNIRRIEAHGNVTVTDKDQSAKGEIGVYDLRAKTVTLTGNVVVSQGNNVIHGERVVVDTVTGNAHVEAAPGTSQGRVRALIIPNKDGKGRTGNFMTVGPGATR